MKPLKIFALAVAVLAMIYLSAIYFVPELFNILSKVLSLMVPFIVAALLALLMEPLVSLITGGTPIKRPLAVALSMTTVLGVIGLLVVLAVIRLTRELIDLSVSLPHYVKPVQEFILLYFERSKILYFSLPPEITDRVSQNLGAITGALSNSAGSIALYLVGLASVLPQTVLGIIVAVIATYFFSRDRDVLVKFWLNMVPEPWGQKSLGVIRETSRAFLSYLRAQLFLITLTTVQAIAGLYIIGAEYALTMGLLIGFFDILPMLGPATIIIPWAAWSFISGDMAFGIKLAVLYVILWVVRQSLEARVVAAELGLHPLAVLSVMYIGLKLIGVAGVILGPVLLIAGQAIYRYSKTHN
ncbi:MAG: sporulation integral membrane protein YtvI [Bacillota bacterium]